MTQDKHHIDVQTGQKLRFYREQQNMSRELLADKMGVSLSLIEKYESAKVRITMSALWELCQALNVSIFNFVDGLGEGQKFAMTQEQKKAAYIASKIRLENIGAWLTLGEILVDTAEPL